LVAGVGFEPTTLVYEPENLQGYNILFKASQHVGRQHF
jgi:hypothetical protein